jgi:hypothetical protein
MPCIIRVLTSDYNPLQNGKYNNVPSTTPYDIRSPNLQNQSMLSQELRKYSSKLHQKAITDKYCDRRSHGSGLSEGRVFRMKKKSERTAGEIAIVNPGSLPRVELHDDADGARDEEKSDKESVPPQVTAFSLSKNLTHGHGPNEDMHA